MTQIVGVALVLAACADDGGAGTGTSHDGTSGTTTALATDTTTGPGATTIVSGADTTTAGATTTGASTTGATTDTSETTSTGGSTTDGATTEDPSTTGGSTSDGGPSCGDGSIDPGEQCDGLDLQGFDCASLGLGGGILACDPVTCLFDPSGCMVVGPMCGDGVIDPGEQCDGLNLQGFDCTALGLGGGVLACDPVICTFDTSMCMPGGGGTGG